MRFDARAFLEELYAVGSVATAEPELERASSEGLPASAFVQTERGHLVPDNLPEPWRAWYEERTAIREYDGGQVREHAEAEALRETIDAMRTAGEHPPTDI